MPIPILLVTGFLGAGKTTVVNQILAHAQGKRIAAVVNDFGAINIDAELIAGASNGVVSLANGCICCSLEGDLLRTLAGILRRNPRPDYVVIETSGVADPGDIVRNLMDPVIWKEAPLETVLCVMDSTTPLAKLDDALLLSQLRAADVVALSKTDLVDEAGRERTRDAVKAGPAAGGDSRCPAWPSTGVTAVSRSRRPRASSAQLATPAPDIRPVRDHELDI